MSLFGVVNYIPPNCLIHSRLIISVSLYYTVYSIIMMICISLVQLCNCQISTKPGGEADDKWSPWTPWLVHLRLLPVHHTVHVLMYSC